MGQNLKTRSLLSASIMAMASVGLLVGGTYALFTDSAKISNHLQAGNLNISLIRTSYTKHTLNDSGYLEDVSNSVETDFSGDNKENVFGLDDGEMIVPASSFLANMKLINGVKNGNSYTASSVAFSYDVKIDVSEEANKDLISQLNVVVKKGNEEVANKKLSEFNSDAVFSGKMTKNDTAVEFSVKLTFEDLGANENNKAQDKTAGFDLVVEATQLTSNQ